jgi:hypothetical protein
MNRNKILANDYQHLLIFFIFYLTVLLGYYFNEDNLGGAIVDSTYHFKISQKFSENFYQTYLNYGNTDLGLAMGTRNSPIFWMFLSVLDRFMSFDMIRVLNTLIIFFIALIFYKCLLLKFKDVNRLNLILLSTFIFLSPSLRSLAIWPYSLIWGLFFFVVSIYYYLKYKNDLNFSNSFKILFFLILSSYIYPSFGIFYLYYISKIKNKKILLGLLFCSLILSMPAIFYFISKDFLNSYQDAQGVKISGLQSLNFSNKILIISTICFYLLLPIINFKEILNNIKKIKLVEFFFITIFCLINFYFFNFPNSIWGGGFFHKLSNFAFSNNYFFFISAFLSILIIYFFIEKKNNNLLLLLILILYNPQFTIYLKYFDPLVLIVFLTLIDFDLKKQFINKSYRFYQFYGIIAFYYIAAYGKKILI